MKVDRWIDRYRVNPEVVEETVEGKEATDEKEEEAVEEG